MKKVHCCNDCMYYTKDLKNFKKHLKTNKHIKLIEQKSKMNELIKQNEIIDTKNKLLVKQLNDKLIEENNQLKKIVNDTLQIAKDTTKSANTSAKTSMGILKYANLYFKDAEPIEMIKHDDISKVMGYKNPKNIESKNETYVKMAIHKYNHHIFHSFIGDMIVEYYKPKTKKNANLIATDTSRLSFIIMQKITNSKTKQKEWINDKSGKKFTELVLEPLINAVKQTLIEFIEFKKTKELNETNLCLMAKCVELRRDIEVKKFTNQILKYVAPHFHFDNLKLLDDINNLDDSVNVFDVYENVSRKIKIN